MLLSCWFILSNYKGLAAKISVLSICSKLWNCGIFGFNLVSTRMFEKAVKYIQYRNVHESTPLKPKFTKKSKVCYSLSRTSILCKSKETFCNFSFTLYISIFWKCTTFFDSLARSNCREDSRSNWFQSRTIPKFFLGEIN